MEEPLFFPVHLFTCATLTKFQLCMNHIFKVLSFIHFESLRTLILDDIIFSDSSSAQYLFSGCSSLEELVLFCCSWVNVKAVYISSSALQKLIIREWGEDDDDLNVSNRCNGAIVGTKLRSFSYDGDLKNDYFLYSPTSVIHAPDYYWLDGWEFDTGYLAFNLIKELSNVEKLSISEVALSAITSTTSLPLRDLPCFCNLAELRVFSISPMQLSCEALLTILQKSPCLQVTEFLGGVHLPNDSSNNNYMLDPVPMCFRKNLKTIKIRAFAQTNVVDEKLHAIKFLLQEASVLETLHIDCCLYGFDSSPTR